jgi:uncharacterized low-complexity protein
MMDFSDVTCQQKLFARDHVVTSITTTGRGKRPKTRGICPTFKTHMEAFQMSQESTKKPLSIAIGAAFATSLAAAPIANAADNPFTMSELSSGYMVADSHMEGKCGEGKCGENKKMEEGKCGENKKMEEGKCGGDKTMKEGKCGGDKTMKEGKCGEGKCGANK